MLVRIFNKKCTVYFLKALITSLRVMSSISCASSLPLAAGALRIMFLKLDEYLIFCFIGEASGTLETKNKNKCYDIIFLEY